MKSVRSAPRALSCVHRTSSASALPGEIRHSDMEAGSCHLVVVHPDRRSGRLGRGKDEVDQKTGKDDRCTLFRRRITGLLPLAVVLPLTVVV